MTKHEPGARSIQHDTGGEKYYSLLGAAVANGHSDMVAFLLKHGAHPDSPVNGSFRCLDTAAMQGNAEIVRNLLDSGAAVQTSVDDFRDTQPCPLHRAAESGRTEIVRILLAHSTYAAAQWHPDMDYVLEAAIYRHDDGMLRMLYGKMCAAKKAIAGAMYAVNNHRGNNADQQVKMFKVHAEQGFHENSILKMVRICLDMLVEGFPAPLTILVWFHGSLGSTDEWRQDVIQCGSYLAAML